MNNHTHHINTASINLSVTGWPNTTQIKSWVEKDLLEMLDALLCEADDISGETVVQIDKLQIDLPANAVNITNHEALKKLIAWQLKDQLMHAIAKEKDAGKRPPNQWNEFIQFLQTGILPVGKTISGLRNESVQWLTKPELLSDAQLVVLFPVLLNQSSLLRLEAWLQSDRQKISSLFQAIIARSVSIPAQVRLQPWIAQLSALQLSPEKCLLLLKTMVGMANATAAVQKQAWQNLVAVHVPKARLESEVVDVNHITGDDMQNAADWNVNLANGQPEVGSHTQPSAKPAAANMQPNPATDVTIKHLEISNAGMVLLTPYLPQYFRTIGIRPLAGSEQQQLATMHLHYLTTGQQQAEDWQLVLPKIMCGLPVETFAAHPLDLSDFEKAEVVHLFTAMLHHWERLRNTSMEGLRQAFLQRPGFLTHTDTHTEVSIPERTEDILLQFVPWNFRMVKLPWMKQLLQVKWGA